MPWVCQQESYECSETRDGLRDPLISLLLLLFYWLIALTVEVFFSSFLFKGSDPFSIAIPLPVLSRPDSIDYLIRFKFWIHCIFNSRC